MMSKITILDTPQVTLWYHPEEKIVHHYVHKFLYGEEFQAFILKVIELMKTHHATKWLSNDEGNTVLRKEDMDWGQTNWFPQTVAAGWKYWAIVQPKAAIAKMNMKNMVKQYSQAGIIAQFFSSEDEAWNWLVAQK
jgi:hypothetical protein